MNQIQVNTPQGAYYPIIIGEQVLAQVGALIREQLGKSGAAALVTNPTVGTFYAKKTAQSLNSAGFSVGVLEVPDGEQYKTLETVRDLYHGLLDLDLDRNGVVIALGGGVVGDMAGFAAATYLRGVPFVQIPTSLLAMVDASVGGKTGVDLKQGKNLVGAFKQPALVAIDTSVLATLDAAERVSGMAEVVKHGLIGDPMLFDQLERGIPENVTPLVDAAVRVKVAVVARDPFEKGERALLNLGHTFGHAIELLSKFSMRHGEAVAVGMVAAARLSALLGKCEASLVGRIERVLSVQGLPTRIEHFGVDDIIAAMRHDKKKVNQGLRFVIPVAPGTTQLIADVPETVIRQAIAWIRKG
ncbi:MAG: 3-dehydroquinate synthase [Myxococcota bacterium]|nr:3-dehydroquinate synthase [Myxococcota bacterium]